MSVKNFSYETSHCFLIGQDGSTPLYAAAGTGQLEVVTKFLDSGADVHEKANVKKFHLLQWIVWGCITPKQLCFC